MLECEHRLARLILALFDSMWPVTPLGAYPMFYFSSISMKSQLIFPKINLAQHYFNLL